MAKKVDPFYDLIKARDLVRGAIGSSVFRFHVLDTLQLIERSLFYVVKYHPCFDKDYMESPSINKNVEPIELFIDDDLPPFESE